MLQSDTKALKFYGLILLEGKQQLLVDIITKLKLIHPFNNIMGKSALLLEKIAESVPTDKMIIISQISEEISNMEISNRKNEKINVLSNIFGIVGVLLTIFFGISSFIK